MGEAVGDFGLIGLAVMGQNLVLNMNDHGFTVVVFNRTVSKVDAFLDNEAKGTQVVGAHSIAEFCAKLKRPRRCMLLVKAGSAVDDFIELLLPHLEQGDVIIDGGNSNYNDSERRTKYVESKGLLFVGTGVSGGEEGARYGPSLMPGGSAAAWPTIQSIFQSVAAKSDDEPCCDWVGDGGAGHYVKMVHNGIEYGDMQLICEAYSLLKNVAGCSHEEIASIFAEWNKTELDSYLIEITANILAHKDEDGSPMVDKILDKAGQKGTGKWTVESSLDNAVPVTLIAEAVFARQLSAMKDERVAASSQLAGPKAAYKIGNKDEYIESVRQALYASKICSYAQGYMLLREAAKEYSWKLNLPAIALMWRGGCIIRSKFLANIRDAFTNKPDLLNLLLDDFFKQAVDKAQSGWREAVASAAYSGVPVPAFSTALSFYDGYRTAVLPANILQAQRDYFGAHMYERTDKPRGEWFHTNWTGTGGNITSSTYNA
ncbi:6-phosphogluconate dehydrogenase, decarboxylating [Porphyridium purpureum]|uniref:6-phosphogluconate dehydrogenase, decarboxylating n=1 Tax=Porphyridium purpureum TaxID=35688 RepID=A0A5J4YJ37_PORPP|nr:6-phosphogluconate dehydrogenase, decarboxylating [Porphyridium purpureum]|eukprot:POR4685..scf251_18